MGHGVKVGDAFAVFTRISSYTAGRAYNDGPVRRVVTFVRGDSVALGKEGDPPAKAGTLRACVDKGGGVTLRPRGSSWSARSEWAEPWVDEKHAPLARAWMIHRSAATLAEQLEAWLRDRKLTEEEERELVKLLRPVLERDATATEGGSR